MKIEETELLFFNSHVDHIVLILIQIILSLFASIINSTLAHIAVNNEVTVSQQNEPLQVVDHLVRGALNDSIAHELAYAFVTIKLVIGGP